jgi:hypothetical protein
MKEIPVWVWIVGAVGVVLLLARRAGSGTGNGATVLPSDANAAAIQQGQTAAKVQAFGDVLSFLHAETASQTDAAIAAIQAQERAVEAQYNFTAATQALGVQSQQSANALKAQQGQQSVSMWQTILGSPVIGGIISGIVKGLAGSGGNGSTIPTGGSGGYSVPASVYADNPGLTPYFGSLPGLPGSGYTGIGFGG